MKIFFKKQELNTMASVITSLLLVSGCRSASVNSTNDERLTPGTMGSPPAYRSYSQSPEPYDSDAIEAVPPPTPPAALPTPGYTEPELPPTPTTSKSRWNFLQSNFKFPSMSRQNSDVRQMGAKSDDRGIAFKSGKNKSVTPTLRDGDARAAEEVVRPRSTGPSRSTGLPQLSADATPITNSSAGSGMETPASTSESAFKIARNPQIRSRNAAPMPASAPRFGTHSSANSNSNVDVPPLSVPSATDETNEVPRLLLPSE